MNRPYLTIGIPTYNRSSQLAESLEHITKIITKNSLNNDVEIFISNNASTDNTEEMVKSFQKNYQNIRYAKNDVNLGYDRNVDKVLTEARGNFCWTLSDDDYINDESIVYILSIIKENPNVAYICIDNDAIVDGKDGVKIKDGNELFQKYNSIIGGLLSQNIYNKDFLAKGREKYYGNLWFHLSVALETVGKNEMILVKNIFKGTDIYAECRWAKGGVNLTTFLSLKKIIENLVSLGFKRDVVKRTIKNLAKDLPHTVASAKLVGLKVSRDTVYKLCSEFYNYKFNLFIAVCVLFTPTFFLRVIRFLKRMV